MRTFLVSSAIISNMASRLELISTELLIPNVSNPRHSVVATPQSAVSALMEKMPKKIYSLAKDIAEFGLDPSSLPIVVEEEGYYVALEGNRRVAAILLMRDPDLIELDSTLRTGFRALHDLDVVPDEIACVVFDEREEADHWIELRHTGENDGAGIVRWGAPEQQRFRRQRGSQTDVAMRFAEAMRALFPEDVAFLRDVDTVEAEVSTTLGRVIQNPARRSQLGFEQRDGVLYLRYDPEDILPLLERLFNDLATGTENVTNLRDRDYMDSYVERIVREVPYLGNRLREPIPVDEWIRTHPDDGEDGSDGDSESGGTSGSSGGGGSSGGDGGDDEDGDDEGSDTGRGRRRRRRDERRIFQGITLSYLDLRVSDVLKEAQKLDIDVYPNLCSIMLRVVLDLVTASFYDHLGRSNEASTEFKAKIRSCANKVDPTVSDPDLARARVLIESDGALSPKTMNGFVHGWNRSPLASEVRAISAAYGPLIVKLDEYIRDNPRA